MAAGDKGFTVQAAGSGAKVIMANGDKVLIKGHGHVSIDVGKGSTKARMVLAEAMLVPDLTSNLLSVRAVDRNSGAVVFVGDGCYILRDRRTFVRAECSTRRWSWERSKTRSSMCSK